MVSCLDIPFLVVEKDKMISGKVPEDTLAEAKRAHAYSRCGHWRQSALVPCQQCGSLKVYAVRFPRAELQTRMGVADRKRMGEGKVHIVTRVLGIVRAALAVQLVLNGIAGYYDTLISR